MSETIGAMNLVVEHGKPTTIRLNPESPSVYVGEKRLVEMLTNNGGGALWLRSATDGKLRASLSVYENGLAINDSDGHNVVHINCEKQILAIGGNKQAGSIQLRNEAGNATATLASESGGLTIGGSLRFEELDQDGDHSAILRVGDGGRNGVIRLRDKQGQLTLTIDGKAGDITLVNGDCAEDFDLARGAEVGAGMVVVLADNGGVQPCTEAYDTRVVGVVSGAGSLRPGIVLDRRPRDGAAATVGLMGKVYCLVDADAAPIHPGSLLTTARLAGHARAATDRARAFGAVLGKALAGLASGQGLLPVLINLH